MLLTILLVVLAAWMALAFLAGAIVVGGGLRPTPTIPPLPGEVPDAPSVAHRPASGHAARRIGSRPAARRVVGRSTPANAG